MTRISSLALAGLLVVVGGVPAFAQARGGAAAPQATGARPATQPAAPAAPAAAPYTPPPPLQGAVIPGLCIFNHDRLVETSRLGQFINTRMNQIQAQTNAEVSERGRTLDAELSNLRAQAAAQGGETAIAAQIDAYNQKRQTYQRDLQIRQAELQETARRALERFDTEASPVLIQVVQTKRCGLVLDEAALVYPDARVDITADVATALDAKIQQFSIEKAQIDESRLNGAAGAPAAGAQPAAPR